MSRIFFEREKEEKKQWGRKGTVMESRRRLGSEEEGEKNGQKVSLKAGGKWKRDRKEDHVYCKFGVA